MPVRLRHIPLLLLLASPAACDHEPAEVHGFVATLGSDTTSVERITRIGNRITGDAIGRSPVVTRRRWEVTLAPDGAIRHWSMDTHIPNAPPGQTDLHHELTIDSSTVRLLRATGTDTTDVAYTIAYPATVPWNAFLYGSWELLLQAARQHPDSTLIGQYFFEGWAEGTIGHARVHALGDGRYSISSTGLSGAGVARVDDAGRLLSYSGAGTTYLQEVQRVTDVPDIDGIAARFAAEEKARGVERALSVRDTARAPLGSATVIIDYSRPRARGRTLLGGVIPWNRVWRTGANAATHITFSHPVRLAGIDLDSGTYTLWTLPAPDNVQLIINRQTGQWGTSYQSSQDIARVQMHVDTTAAVVEQFTIAIVPRADSPPTTADLVMEWGRFRWSAPLIARSP